MHWCIMDCRNLADTMPSIKQSKLCTEIVIIPELYCDATAMGAACFAVAPNTVYGKVKVIHCRARAV